MVTRQSSMTRLLSALALGVILSVEIAPMVAWAQEYVPPSRGLPGRREGGGTRGGCAQTSIPLTALMPDSNFGRTTAIAPKLYWYVPDAGVENAEFVLLDQFGNEVYTATLPVAETEGVIELEIPAENGESLLQQGEDYHWFFSLVCNPLDRSGDIFSEGWIQRVEPDAALNEQLATATPIEQVSIYAQSGIWHDALSTVLDLRRNEPTNTTYETAWQNLLESVGLGAMVDQQLQP